MVIRLFLCYVNLTGLEPTYWRSQFKLLPLTAKRSERRQVLSPQPTLRTEKDIGSKNPESTAVSGFCYAIFQGGIQKISFPKNDLWGGLELNSTDIKGRFYD